MRVLCIDNTGATELVEGDVYNASQCPINDDCYDIEEFPFDIHDLNCHISYYKWHFIPLQDEHVEIEMDEECYQLEECLN